MLPLQRNKLFRIFGKKKSRSLAAFDFSIEGLDELPKTAAGHDGAICRGEVIAISSGPLPLRGGDISLRTSVTCPPGEGH